MKRYVAFMVGIDEYSHLERLFGATNDAQKLWEQLTDSEIGIFDADCSRLILNPTKDYLENEIASFIDTVEPGDVFLFYFAGHAAAIGSRLYLATKDTRLLRSKYLNSATALPFSTIEDLMRFLPSASIVTILDACQSGALIEEQEMNIGMDELRAALNSSGSNMHKVIGHGYQYLLACRPHQRAEEKLNKNAWHGLLTTSILKALSSGANTPSSEEFLSFNAVCRYVQDQMSNLEFQQPVQFSQDLTGPTFIAQNINFKPPKNWDVTFDRDFFDILVRFNNAGEGYHQATKILTGNQRTIWRKLEHWEVVASPKRGHGHITERGKKFLSGEIDLPKKLYIKDNKVQRKSPEAVNLKNF